MLVYKEPEEKCIHKIIGYGAIMFLLLYIIRLIKYLGKRDVLENDRGARKSRANISPRGNAEKRSKSRHRNRRRHKTVLDQCPQNYCSCSCSFHDQE